AAFAAWLAWRGRWEAPSLVAVGAGWALVEFARTHAPLPSPWGLAAYAAPEPLVQIADLAGPWGVGALLAASAFAAARAAHEGLRAPGARRALAGASAALATAALYGAWRLAQPVDAGEPVRVAVVQGAVVHDRDGAAPARSGANLERHLELTRAALPAAPALVF